MEQEKENSVESLGEKDMVSYYVCGGDCLWSIAEKYYGDGTKWWDIYDVNRSVIGMDPNCIHPGQRITILLE